MTHYLTKEEVERALKPLLYEFADSASDRDGNIDSVGSSNFDITSKSVLDTISQIRQNDLEVLVEWAEKQQPSIGIIAASGMSSEAAEYMNGFYKLKSDFIAHLSSLTSK